MKKDNLVQLICLGGILSALTVILHGAPVFLPAIGMMLSPFSTLPIAVATVWNIFLGIGVLISSALLLLLISPQEALILLFTTGLFGLVLGCLVVRVKKRITILVSMATLTLGILGLTYVIAIPAFVEFTSNYSFTMIVLCYLLFSLGYAVLWVLFLSRVIARVKTIRLSE